MAAPRLPKSVEAVCDVLCRHLLSTIPLGCTFFSDHTPTSAHSLPRPLLCHNCREYLVVLGAPKQPFSNPFGNGFVAVEVDCNVLCRHLITTNPLGSTFSGTRHNFCAQLAKTHSWSQLSIISGGAGCCTLAVLQSLRQWFCGSGS